MQLNCYFMLGTVEQLSGPLFKEDWFLINSMSYPYTSPVQVPGIPNDAISCIQHQKHRKLKQARIAKIFSTMRNKRLRGVQN